MISITYFEIIVLCFKIIAFNSLVSEATIGYNVEGEYIPDCYCEYIYDSETDELNIYYISQDGNYDEFLIVRTIDNALYELTFTSNNSKTTIDLAPYYSSINWDIIGSADQTISDSEGNPLTITYDNDYVYVVSSWFGINYAIDKDLLYLSLYE